MLPGGCWSRPYSWYLDAISRSSLSSKGMGTLGTEVSKQICSIQTDKFSRPKDAYELFNLRHSSARNVIERMFGIIKLRFKILEEVAISTYSSKLPLFWPYALCTTRSASMILPIWLSQTHTQATIGYRGACLLQSAMWHMRTIPAS